MPELVFEHSKIPSPWDIWVDNYRKINQENLNTGEVVFIVDYQNKWGRI